MYIDEETKKTQRDTFTLSNMVAKHYSYSLAVTQFAYLQWGKNSFD